ncbi:MAG: pyridoxal-dependent decarboxylase [Parvularculaceae bacterium]
MDDFRKWAARAAEWGADYREGLGASPVRPTVEPGSVAAKIPDAPPEAGEAFENIFADFERLIAPAMTHWQHPRFFAYFPANAAPASVVAEHLVNALGAQCMLWQTSPAATELETAMMDWMRQALGLPASFRGVIQDTATTTALIAALMMREKALGFRGLKEGLSGAPRLRVYCSAEAHVSIDRAMWFSGIGADNFIRIPIKGEKRGADPAALEALIADDMKRGYKPAGIIANVGATGAGAIDPVADLARIAKKHGLFLHVDAAWAGSAMICEEFRELWAGVEEADSVVVNAHKWLGAQFDCTLHFVKDPGALIKTLAARPDYLQTPGHDDIVNYSEWSLPLGRRFRALKLWFLLRAEGLEGLRAMIRNHVKWSRALCERLRAEPDFEITTEPSLSLFTFRHAPQNVSDLDVHNLSLVERINADGRIYLTQTRIDGRVVIRFQAGSVECAENDFDIAFKAITEVARSF